MRVISAALEGILVLEPARIEDSRGFFSQTWSRAALLKLGIDVEFVQDNQSWSSNVHTVRGLHFQGPPHAQAKLVRCGRGRLFDVAVDIRKGSPTFGSWMGTELSFINGRQVFIPHGFLHGFATMEPHTEVIYKSSDYYFPDLETAVRFDDPEIGINWGFPSAAAVLSEKDRWALSLFELETPFMYSG